MSAHSFLYSSDVFRFAAGYGHVSAVAWLLSKGAEVNAVGAKDGSALVRAARFGRGFHFYRNRTDTL